MARQTAALFVLALCVASFGIAAAARPVPRATPLRTAAGALARRVLGETYFPGSASRASDLGVQASIMTAQAAVMEAADSYDPIVAHAVANSAAAHSRSITPGYGYAMYSWRR